MTERERMAPERNASMGFGRRALGGLKALTKRKEEVSIPVYFHLFVFIDSLSRVLNLTCCR